MNELGGEQIKLNLASETLRARLNLSINCRMLLDSCEIVKCSTCFAPVSESMIEPERFKKSLHGKAWRCDNRTCLKQNAAGVQLCEGCGATIPSSMLGKDLIFSRFQRINASKELKLFKFALKALPMIESSQDIVSLIDIELEKTVFEKQSEAHKHEKLSKFNRIIQQYCRESDKSVFKHMSELGLPEFKNIKDDGKLRLMLAEKEYLDKLVVELEEHAQRKKHHQRLLKEYQATLSKIN